MKQLRILEAHELGHGILVEMDAGWVDPNDTLNSPIMEQSNKV